MHQNAISQMQQNATNAPQIHQNATRIQPNIPKCTQIQSKSPQIQNATEIWSNVPKCITLHPKAIKCTQMRMKHTWSLPQMHQNPFLSIIIIVITIIKTLSRLC